MFFIKIAFNFFFIAIIYKTFDFKVKANHTKYLITFFFNLVTNPMVYYNIKMLYFIIFNKKKIIKDKF